MPLVAVVSLCAEIPCPRAQYIDGLCKHHHELRQYGANMQYAPDERPPASTDNSAEWLHAIQQHPPTPVAPRPFTTVGRGQCRVCRRFADVRSDTGECVVCWRATNKLHATGSRSGAKTETATPEEIAHREEFAAAILGVPAGENWRELPLPTSQVTHPLIFTPRFCSGSGFPELTKPVEPRLCLHCARGGFTKLAVENPTRPWEDAWRLCGTHAAEERNRRSNARSRTVCAACGWRTDLRPGQALDEACHKAWQRARRKGETWNAFAARRRAWARAAKVAMSLDCADQKCSSTSDDWRAHWTPRANGTNVVLREGARGDDLAQPDAPEAVVVPLDAGDSSLSVNDLMGSVPDAS